MNKIMIIGLLGGEPELRYAANGSPIVNMRIATDESYTDRNQNKVSRTEWHSVVAFQCQAEMCITYLSKGSLVFVEGKLQTRKWQDQHGQTRYSTEIKATHIQPLTQNNTINTKIEDNSYVSSHAWQAGQPPEPHTIPSESEFAHILPTWTQAALEQLDPFCSLPAWQLAFHEAFSPKQRLLVEHSSDSVLCFAENINSPLERYISPIESHWFFGCPLLGRNAVELLREMIKRITKNCAPHSPKILISGIVPDSLLEKQLLSMFANDFNMYINSKQLQCAASLSGGVDGFLSRRSANFRNKIKKSCKRALASGVEFERILLTSPEEASSIYSRMLHVEHASWKGNYGNLPIEDFYAALIRRLSMQAAAKIIMAKHGDKDIGFIFGGIAGNIYRGLQFSYDEKWKEFSIGNILQLEQIKWLCEENISRYDIGELKSHMSYKEFWTEIRIPSLCLRMERK